MDKSCCPRTATEETAPPSAKTRPAPYWDEACRWLSANDAVMAQLIADFPGEALKSDGEPFSTLFYSIVGQQISLKAAEAIRLRVMAVIGEATPEGILSASTDDLRQAGLSARKVEYLVDLARHFEQGTVAPDRWPHLEDEALIKELTDIRGVGRWTAEMLMMFCLLRPDVFPADDLGVQRAIILHYPEILEGNAKPTPRVFRQFAQRWAPWQTVASWYLWRSLDPIPVAY